MLLADTLLAILAKIGSAPVGSVDPPTQGNVELNLDVTGALAIPILSSQGIRLVQPVAGGPFLGASLAAVRLIRAAQVFPARLFFANGSGASVFGQVFNSTTAPAPGAVPADVVVVPAGNTAQIVYPLPPGRFDQGAIIAFSSTFLTYTATGAIGLLGWDEYQDFV